MESDPINAAVPVKWHKLLHYWPVHLKIKMKMIKTNKVKVTETFL